MKEGPVTLEEALASLKEEPLTVGELEVAKMLGEQGVEVRPEDYMRLVAFIWKLTEDEEPKPYTAEDFIVRLRDVTE